VISRPSSKSVVTISRMLPGVLLPVGAWGCGEGFAMVAELTRTYLINPDEGW